jgi:undecaprenyl-diphosphatase
MPLGDAPMYGGLPVDWAATLRAMIPPQPRRRRPSLNPSLRITALAIISFVVAAIVGVALGIAASGDSVLPGDLAVTRDVQRLDGQPYEALARIGNAVGSTVGGLVAIALVMLLAALWRAWRDLFFLVMLLLLRLVATQLKPLFDSPRPPANLVEIHGTFDGTGFPSGHATTGMVMALGLSVIAWRWARHEKVAIALTSVFLGVALLIGLARIWSGAHWPSDVLGGYAFGVAIVALALLIRDRQAWLER